ncbi:hypothetical protein ACFVWC_26860 [Bacillus mycoides]|uniref:hypothetical protein n=1 Tax=Bacillus TaxID=1386 RepID=UPI001911F0CE|nr:hypothetical protein [Bacillus sp. TH25]MBK5432207.1 hypothetical protein [Bacillus sp. TH25]
MFVNSANLVQISSLDKSLMVVGQVGTGKTRELKKMALSLSKVFIYFLQQMKDSDIKVIASFQQMPTDPQITKKFRYIISLDVTNDFDKITEYEKYNYDSGFGFKK